MSARATLRRTWPVLAAYAVFSTWGMVCLVASLLVGGKFGGAGELAALGGVIVASIVGHVAGNALGLARLRLAVVVVVFTVLSVAASLLAVGIGPLAAYVLLGLVAALSGYLGVASRLDVVASWFPLSLSVAAAMIWMNTHGALRTFESGSKHAVWDPFALLCLSGGVFFMLVFLATRHSLALTVWQEIGRRGARAQDADQAGVAVARPGRGSLLVLMAFTIVVLAITALVSPYLFRTTHDENGQGGSSSQEQGKEQGQEQAQGKGEGEQRGKGGRAHGGSSAGSGQRGGEGAGSSSGNAPSQAPDPEHASEAAREAMKNGAQIMMWLLALALLLLLLMAIAFPPVRRAVLLRHLERPLWPVPPTARVMNLWRRARAELAVVDLEPAPGETPSGFAARAESEIGEAPGLRDAAAIVEKIDYAGRGLAAEDALAMRGAVSRFVAAFAPRVRGWKRVRAAWSKAPEVEQ